MVGALLIHNGCLISGWNLVWMLEGMLDTRCWLLVVATN
jgi:hypothetical protein